MIYLRTNLIAGLIKLVFDIVGLCFKYLFKILKSLHLRLFFIICLTGVFLEFSFNTLTNNATNLIIFLTLAGFSFVRFVYLNFDKYFINNIKVKSPKEKENKQAIEYNEEIPVKSKLTEHTATKKSDKPYYFRVSQNPKYLMAEYEDRYELYYEGKDGLKFIRTDFKNIGDEKYE